MLKIVRSNRFKKDLINAIKRGYDLSLLEEVIEILAKQESLPHIYNDHPLIGKYKNFRECHIKSDWLLVYHIDDYELELFLFRTGTHSDLFG